jgi:hypothetical protein
MSRTVVEIDCAGSLHVAEYDLRLAIAVQIRRER